jgi:hypothetical protein
MADRHNLSPNPYCKNDNTGWTSNGTAPTRTDVTGLGFSRTWAAKYDDGSVAFSPQGAASAGLQYTVSVYVRPTVFTISGSIFVEFLNSGGGSLDFSSTAFTANANTVTRISHTHTAPANTAFVRFVITGENYGSNATYFTQHLIEQTGSLDTYFDGDSAGGSWDGADGNSASTLSSGSAVSGDVTATTTASVTATGSNAAAGAASPTSTAATTATGANAAAGAAAPTTTATVTATGANTAAGNTTSTATAGVTATGSNAATGAVAATTTASVTATATVVGLGATATTEAVVTATATLTHSNTGGSWYSLLDITREAASIRAAEQSRRPVACPNDGQPLESVRGVLHCKFDGWTYGG